MTYLDDGRTVARAVFLHQFSRLLRDAVVLLQPGHSALSLEYLALAHRWIAMRPGCLGSLACGAVRCVAAHASGYLAVVLLLSMLTGVSWYSVFIMPDILGPLVYLAIYLLVFAPETLSRAERFRSLWRRLLGHHRPLPRIFCWRAGYGFCWPVSQHSNGARFLQPHQGVGEVAANSCGGGRGPTGSPRLSLRKALAERRAPALSDGAHHRRWPRTHLSRTALPTGAMGGLQPSRAASGRSDDFLWGPDGAYSSASDDESELMSQQEMPFVLATMRAYPRESLRRRRQTSGISFQEALAASSGFTRSRSSLEGLK
jgi:hypothetical protein